MSLSFKKTPNIAEPNKLTYYKISHQQGIIKRLLRMALNSKLYFIGIFINSVSSSKLLTGVSL